MTRHLALQRTLEPELHLESAGTAGYHIGKSPDPRAIQQARYRGVDISGLRARRFEPSDFERFDLVVAMDTHNATDLSRLANSEQARSKIVMYRSFDPSSAVGGDLDVPDPYYGDPSDFDLVIDLAWRCSTGLLDSVAQKPSRPDR